MSGNHCSESAAAATISWRHAPQMRACDGEARYTITHIQFDGPTPQKEGEFIYKNNVLTFISLIAPLYSGSY